MKASVPHSGPGAGPGKQRAVPPQPGTGVAQAGRPASHQASWGAGPSTERWGEPKAAEQCQGAPGSLVDGGTRLKRTTQRGCLLEDGRTWAWDLLALGHRCILSTLSPTGSRVPQILAKVFRPAFLLPSVSPPPPGPHPQPDKVLENIIFPSHTCRHAPQVRPIPSCVRGSTGPPPGRWPSGRQPADWPGLLLPSCPGNRHFTLRMPPFCCPPPQARNLFVPRDVSSLRAEPTTPNRQHPVWSWHPGDTHGRVGDGRPPRSRSWAAPPQVGVDTPSRAGLPKLGPSLVHCCGLRVQGTWPPVLTPLTSRLCDTPAGNRALCARGEACVAGPVRSCSRPGAGGREARGAGRARVAGRGFGRKCAGRGALGRLRPAAASCSAYGVPGSPGGHWGSPSAHLQGVQVRNWGLGTPEDVRRISSVRGCCSCPPIGTDRVPGPHSA